MQRLKLVAALALAASSLAAAAGAQAPYKSVPTVKLSPAAAHGKQLWDADGCYQCHGYQGQGTTGPKLGPQPLPFDAFANQVRKPRDRMPVYTAKVLPDSDLNDVYAYMQSIPKAKAPADIPLLNQ